MVRKLLLILFLLTFPIAITAQSEEAKSNTHAEKGSSNIYEVIASPNPLNVATTIKFKADKIFALDFYVKDLLGNMIYTQKVKTKIGVNTIPFSREELESGIYIYSLKTEEKVISKRIVIK